MINADIRVRCISGKSLRAILDLLADEANSLYVDYHVTQELPRGGRATIISPKKKS